LKPTDFPVFGTNSAFVTEEQTLAALQNPYIVDANATQRTIDLLQEHEYQGIHVLRDRRDLTVSAYFSHLNTHSTEDWPELAKQREKLKGLSEEDGLIATIQFLDFVWEAFRTIQADHRDYRIHTMMFEEFIENPVKAWQDVVEWYRWDVDVESVVEHFSFEKLTGRKQGEEDQNHHMRKGIVGDWKNHFTPKVQEFYDEYFGL